jgi:hypothetical protein
MRNSKLVASAFDCSSLQRFGRMRPWWNLNVSHESCLFNLILHLISLFLTLHDNTVISLMAIRTNQNTFRRHETSTLTKSKFSPIAPYGRNILRENRIALRSWWCFQQSSSRMIANDDNTLVLDVYWSPIERTMSVNCHVYCFENND